MPGTCSIHRLRYSGAHCPHCRVRESSPEYPVVTEADYFSVSGPQAAVVSEMVSSASDTSSGTYTPSDSSSSADSSFGGYDGGDTSGGGASSDF